MTTHLVLLSCNISTIYRKSADTVTFGNIHSELLLCYNYFWHNICLLLYIIYISWYQCRNSGDLLDALLHLNISRTSLHQAALHLAWWRTQELQSYICIRHQSVFSVYPFDELLHFPTIYLIFFTLSRAWIWNWLLSRKQDVLSTWRQSRSEPASRMNFYNKTYDLYKLRSGCKLPVSRPAATSVLDEGCLATELYSNNFILIWVISHLTLFSFVFIVHIEYIENIITSDISLPDIYGLLSKYKSFVGPLSVRSFVPPKVFAIRAKRSFLF